jgi:uncharacterized protein YlxW (UPF0749 family)
VCGCVCVGVCVCDTSLQGAFSYLLIQELLTKQINISLATCRKPKDSEALNSDTNKQLAAKGEVLKSNNEKQKQLQSAIDALTKTVQSLNWTVQRVSTCKVQTVTTLKCLRLSIESNVGQILGVRRTFWPPTSVFLWEIFISRLCPAPSVQISYPLSNEL